METDQGRVAAGSPQDATGSRGDAAGPLLSEQVWPDGPPRHRHLADLAAAAVERGPDGVSVIFRDERWSYRDIDRWSDGIAAAIRARIGEDIESARVGLLVGRGPAIVAGMVGILKAGAIIVPVDIAQPTERIELILADAAPALVLVDDPERASGPLGVLADRAMAIGSPAALAATQPIRHRPTDGSGPAYILYTSGSTGRPKGVVCSHLGICNLVEDRLAEAPLTEAGRILLTTSISFDPAIYNVFLAMRGGAALIVADEETAGSGAALADLMRREAVTCIDVTPSLLAAIPPGGFPDLLMVSVGGEPCPQRLIDEWAPRVDLDNCYGPTETTVEVARWRWSAGEPGNRIGRPVRNARLRILDAAGLPGEEGELLIGGPMVGLGYLGQPELTAERFFTCSETGLRFYRSGDRVRRVAPDLYDFLGRMDDQIKINGVRVEPEEVRCAIEAVPGVIQAAVAFERSAAGSAMTGYYRATPGTLDRATLMDRLSRRLPSAMIPARLVEVETMPVRASGKVDLERLRQARDTSPVTRSDTRSDVAQVLIGLWCEILNVPEARLSDNFFELGGDSLRLTRLIFAINKAYRVRLTPSAYRTLQDLGALIEHVERAVDSSAGTIPPDRRDGSKAEATTQGASGP